jgi:hypothetical protein
MKGPASLKVLDCITDTTTPAEFLQLLADHGEDINGFMPGHGIQITLLYNTIRRRNMDHVEFLLRCGADVNVICECNGYTALYLLLNGDYSCAAMKRGIELLQRYGANVNFINAYGVSPLTHVIDFGSMEHIEILMDAGAVIDKKLADRFYEPDDDDEKSALRRRVHAYAYAERIEKRKRNCRRTLCAFYAYARQARMPKDLALVVMRIVWSAERRNVVWEYI